MDVSPHDLQQGDANGRDWSMKWFVANLETPADLDNGLRYLLDESFDLWLITRKGWNGCEGPVAP